MTKRDYTVAAGILELPEGDTIRLNSPQWWDWLESDEATAFTFDCDHGIKNYRARKEAIKGKTGKFWYAYKRHEGTLRKRYIGKSEELSLEKLEAVAYDLLTPAKSRESKPELPTQLGNDIGEYREMLNEARKIAIQRESDFERLMAQKVQACKENQELKRQLELLHTQVGNSELDQLKEEKYDLDFENSQLREEIEKLKKQSLAVPASLAEAKEEILRLLPFERDNDFLRAINQDLREQLVNTPSPEKVLEEYEQNHDQIINNLPKPPKEVTRNWVELWRFKSWLKTRSNQP